MFNKKATILGNAISTYNLLLKDFRLNPELHMCTIFTKEYHIECSPLSRHDWYHNSSNIKYWGHRFSIGNALYTNMLERRANK